MTRKRKFKKRLKFYFLCFLLGMVLGQIFFFTMGLFRPKTLSGDGNVNCSRLRETVGTPKVQGLQVQPTRLESAHPTDLSSGVEGHAAKGSPQPESQPLLGPKHADLIAGSRNQARPAHSLPQGHPWPAQKADVFQELNDAGN